MLSGGFSLGKKKVWCLWGKRQKRRRKKRDRRRLGEEDRMFMWLFISWLVVLSFVSQLLGVALSTCRWPFPRLLYVFQCLCMEYNWVCVLWWKSVSLVCWSWCKNYYHCSCVCICACVISIFVKGIKLTCAQGISHTLILVAAKTKLLQRDWWKYERSLVAEELRRLKSPRQPPPQTMFFKLANLIPQ